MRWLLLILALTACQMAPGTGRQGFNILSPGQEQQMGAEEHPQVLKEFGGAYDDPDVQAWVAGIGQRLVRASEMPAGDFRFTVLDSPIINAMALPGGYVYITRGLIAVAASEAEVAGVLAHEIGHVTARHTGQRVSRQALGQVLSGVIEAVVGIPGLGQVTQLGAAAYLQSFSRDQESEADQLGIRYLAGAGYDPHAMASFLAKMAQAARLEAVLAGRDPDSVDQFNFMASHPRTLDRVQAAAASVGAGQGGQQGREQYLAQVDGLAYGEDPAQGVVRGQDFLHPGLGIGFRVPPGFTIVNGQDKVTASHPEGGVIQFDMGPFPQGLADVEAITIGGMAAQTGTMRANTDAGPADLRVVVADGRYRFLFATKPGDTRFAEDFKRTTYSLRRLGPEDKAAIRTLRIRLVPAGPEQELAARMAVPDHKLERFRVLNRLSAGETMGARVKLVVAE